MNIFVDAGYDPSPLKMFIVLTPILNTVFWVVKNRSMDDGYSIKEDFKEIFDL